VESSAQSSFIAVARIVRARGNRGEVLADLYTDFPERFHQLEEAWLEFADQRRQRFRLEDSWQHKGRLVLKFAGVDTISAAEELAGAWVQVEADQTVRLPDGTYFDHDLIGCSVRDISGAELGIVKEVIRFWGNHQLVVEDQKGEFLLPACEGICKEISIEKKEISVDLPDGLIDLNR